MKAITIKQPWASLIVNDIKHYEFRTWKTNYRGKIYIHAGLSTDNKAKEKYSNYCLNYVNGAIIGEAHIVDCILVDEKFKNKILKENKKVYQNASGYAFVLKNIKKYNKPIPCKGQLGLWNMEANY